MEMQKESERKGYVAALEEAVYDCLMNAGMTGFQTKAVVDGKLNYLRREAARVLA